MERLSAREKQRIAELLAEGTPFWRLRQEVPRSESIGMAPVPRRTHACAEERCGLDQQRVPAAHQREMVCRGATCRTAANNQGLLHHSILLPLVASVGFEVVLIVDL